MASEPQPTDGFEVSVGDLRLLVEAQTDIIAMFGLNLPFDDFLTRLCALLSRQIDATTVAVVLPSADPSEPAPISSAGWTGPLVGSDDRQLGWLTVEWADPTAPRPRQRWLLEEFSRITSSVVQRYRLQQSVSQLLADERRSIAEDLHDDPIQAVTAATLRIQRLLGSATDDHQRSQLAETQTVLAGAIDRMRSMLFDLHPPTLDDDGLVAALELYLYERIDPLDIEWELHDRLEHEPTTATASLAYRLAREALSNVALHSRATRVEVTIETDGNGLSVRVVDDGIGCDIEQALHGRAGHLGTVSSRHLAVRASGRWTIESVPGLGTSVDFWLPTGQLS